MRPYTSRVMRGDSRKKLVVTLAGAAFVVSCLLVLAAGCSGDLPTEPTRQASSGPTSSPRLQAEDEYGRYTSSEYDFSLKYPKSYKSANAAPNERSSGSVFARVWVSGTSDSPIVMSVCVRRVSDWPDWGAEDLLDEMRARLSAGQGGPGETNVMLLDGQLTTCAGRPAAWWESSYTSNGAPTIEKDYFLVGRRFSYQITYAAGAVDYSAHAGQFKHLVSSFRLLR